MSTVFGKNTTSSSITVAGHKVYYIDSADAEIVEVEKTAPLEILLGFTWNSDSSALEAVDISNDDYWSRVISQHDKELLQSLGLFVDVDFLKYGSLKKDSSYTYTVIGVYTGIGEGEISADLLSHFTVGISSSHPTYQNVARIICDTSVPVLVKTWKCRVSIGVTFKYNAFKYLLSGTPYWYVIDGEHDTWTDDLSAWGYSEAQPAETLPTVTTEGDFGSYNWAYAGGSGTTLASGATARAYDNYSSGGSVLLDSSKVYAPYGWLYYDNSSVSYLSGVFSIADDSGYLAVKNDSGESKHLYAIRVAVCSSNQATVVPVYDSSNNAYNAFKFTASGTDYYYVLDGIQTDWTDDLSSIGYHDYEEIVLYMPGGMGRTYGSQYGVTSGYTGDPRSQYLYPLYSDPECTIPALYDATKRYEAGYYQTGEWTVKQIQTVTDMPSSTVSQFSDKTTAEILHNDNGVIKLWSINNYVSSYPLYAFSYADNPVSFRFRLRSDGGGS